MNSHERTLAAFLTGELDAAAAREFDEHLLECESCWKAVQANRCARDAAARLREAPPPGLADRISLAVGLAAAEERPRPGRSRRTRSRPAPSRRPDPMLAAGWYRRLRWRLAFAVAAVAAVLAVAIGVRGGSSSTDASPQIAVIVHYARQLSVPTKAVPPDAVAVPFGVPLFLTADGAHLIIKYLRLGSLEVLVAIADRAFPEPDEARYGGKAMWTYTVDGVSLYCPDSMVLIAAPVPMDQLAAVADRIPET